VSVLTLNYELSAIFYTLSAEIHLCKTGSTPLTLLVDPNCVVLPNTV